MAVVTLGLFTLGGVLLSPLSSESRAEDGNQRLDESEESEEIEDLADIEPTIPDSWQGLEHPELGFTVNLPPGSLRERIQPLETSLGRLEMYILGLENNEQVYGVIVADFPSFFEVIPRETRFDGAIAGVLTNIRQRLIQDRQVALSGNPGRILLYEGEDGLVYQHHIYWVGTRLYQTIAAVPARLPQRQRAEFFETAQPFFQSFSLTD
ncbi:MAG: hypothetical protein EA395_04900 [Phormidium sp. GEM2.Bin31]|nr:MAG: hypothetical protein EA395_04900 [Phormidium sp. GEM2.Bin31]